MRAAVIDYDLGNLPSVTKAVERIGVETTIVDGPDSFDDSFDAVILPGVGHFGAGARNLAERKLSDPLRDWAGRGRPLLGICVGLQLLLETSEEDPDARGLGIVPGTVCRLDGGTDLKIPHMGWNSLEVSEDAEVLDAIRPDDLVYFVHSYYVEPEPESVVATTTYAQRFCSAIERDNVVGVQFHPEKSADVGRRVLQRFFDRIGK
jgi:glutamine amidotransferase